MAQFHLPEAINTLNASRWTLLVAKLFGKRHCERQLGKTLTMYEWRGRYYIRDFG